MDGQFGLDQAEETWVLELVTLVSVTAAARGEASFFSAAGRIKERCCTAGRADVQGTAGRVKLLQARPWTPAHAALAAALATRLAHHTTAATVQHGSSPQTGNVCCHAAAINVMFVTLGTTSVRPVVVSQPSVSMLETEEKVSVGHIFLILSHDCKKLR